MLILGISVLKDPTLIADVISVLDMVFSLSLMRLRLAGEIYRLVMRQSMQMNMENIRSGLSRRKLLIPADCSAAVSLSDLNLLMPMSIPIKTDIGSVKASVLGIRLLRRRRTFEAVKSAVG
jgi:hypothetical protein